MSVGRPPITLDKLPSDWKDKTIELATIGASDVEIRAEALDCICHETWTRLIKEEPEFSETVKKAKLLCNVWWEKNGRVNLENNAFSYTGWYMNMKNRFGWKDKTEQSGETKTTTTIISAEPLTDNEWAEVHGK